MRAIYEPKGKAREYAALACNLYRGCGNACGYCYAPSVLRMSRAEFQDDPKPRPNILNTLRDDLERWDGPIPADPVLLCFTCDPYQAIEKEHRITRAAIEILGRAGWKVRILTKNPRAAMILDGDLFEAHGVEFGTTLVFAEDCVREDWEPKAESVTDRIMGLHWARQLGLRTWCSIEPVIDPKQSIEVIHLTARFVDTFKVGKLNHDAALEATIDWRGFLWEALRTLADLDAGYYIKDDLWAFADPEIRQRWKKTATATAATKATKDTKDGEIL